MVGIIGAMHIEVETIKSLMENKTAEKIGGVEFVRGTLHGKEIVIAVCGIGKVAAAMCTQTMILKYSPELILLNHRLRLGKGLPYATTFLWNGTETLSFLFIFPRCPYHLIPTKAMMRSFRQNSPSGFSNFGFQANIVKLLFGGISVTVRRTREKALILQDFYAMIAVKSLPTE